MGRRRTRKQKKEAKHPFAIHWEPSDTGVKPKARKDASEPSVKGQFKKSGSDRTPSGSKRDLAKNSADLTNLASIKKDIIKSLILAAVILASEIVIYLTWL